MEEGRYRPVLDRVDLAEVLRQIREEATRLAEIRDVRLATPSAAQPACILSEKNLVQDLLGNLTTNAIEAYPVGAVVTLDYRQEGGRCVIEGHNPGVIPEQVRGRLFEPYATTKEGGAELGAYAARLLARTLGGDIDFTTSEAAGTRLRVRLPMETPGD